MPGHGNAGTGANMCQGQMVTVKLGNIKRDSDRHPTELDGAWAWRSACGYSEFGPELTLENAKRKFQRLTARWSNMFCNVNKYTANPAVSGTRNMS